MKASETVDLLSELAPKARTIYQTKTFKGGSWAVAAGLIVAIGANVGNIAKRHNPKYAADIDDVMAIVLTIAGLASAGGGGAAILGRAAATDKVKSPKWMPGSNIEKVELDER